MAELIEEKFQSYVERELNEDDSVIVASDERHNSMMARTIDASSLCFSILLREIKWRHKIYMTLFLEHIIVSLIHKLIKI